MSRKAVSVVEWAACHAQVRNRENRNFVRIFRTSLKPFWDNLTGFDVIAFDEWLQTPDGFSANDVVRERYGEEGVQLIERLINEPALALHALFEENAPPEGNP